MSEFRSVFLFGYSGHAFVVIESLLHAGYEIEGYFDLKPAEINPYRLKYLGSEREADVKSIVGGGLVFPAIGDNLIRRRLILLFEELQMNQFVAIDPSANVSRTAVVEKSTYIGKHSIVNARAEIGQGVILNSGCIIEHECKIADFVHIAPGSVLCGNVRVGKASLIGSGSVIKNNVSICDEVTIGAGAVVVKDVFEGGVYIGNPCKRKLE